MNTFTAGDKVRITNYPESDWNGHICTYNQPDAQDETVVSHLVVDDISRSHRWIQTRYLELITAAPKKDEYADMSAEEQVAVLTEELHQVSRSYIAASTHRDNLEHDLKHYDEVMRETKEAQGWCDDGSNKVIATLNDGFTAHYIEPYESEFEIEYEITAGVIVRGTVMITASSEDAAREFFDDSPSDFINPENEATDEVRSLGWDNCEVESV